MVSASDPFQQHQHETAHDKSLPTYQKDNPQPENSENYHENHQWLIVTPLMQLSQI